jgi:hypothetical protein
MFGEWTKTALLNGELSTMRETKPRTIASRLLMGTELVTRLKNPARYMMTMEILFEYICREFQRYCY